MKKKKEKTLSGSPTCGNTLLMRKVEGEQPDWFKLTETALLTTLYNHGERKSITHNSEPRTIVYNGNKLTKPGLLKIGKMIG